MKKEFAIKTNVPTKKGLEYQPIETFKSVVDGVTPMERDNIFVDFRGVTPEMITTLAPNEVFVFGSNLSGMHAGGAARVAVEKFGAVNGEGVGFFGQTYALPTIKHNFAGTMSVDEIKPYINDFIAFACENKDKVFYVTKIGCGIAGHTITDIAPLFREAFLEPNIVLPFEFMNLYCSEYLSE